MNQDDVLIIMGQQIRKAREKKNLTQKELASHIGKTQKAMSSYENGVRAIRVTEIPLICEVLEVNIEYLFGKDNREKQKVFRLYDQLEEPFRDYAIRDLQRLNENQQEFKTFGFVSPK